MGKKAGDIDPELFERLGMDKYIPYFKSYEKLRSEVDQVDIMNGPRFQREVISLHEEFAKLHASIEKEFKQSAANANSAYSAAMLERAGKYFEDHGILSNGIKDSMQLRKQYAEMDPEYMEKIREKNELLALKIFIKEKLENCRMLFQSAKRIYESTAGGPYGKFGYLPHKTSGDSQ